MVDGERLHLVRQRESVRVFVGGRSVVAGLRHGSH